MNASATHNRPRSSMANAIGCITSGSPANSVTLKSSGTVIAAAAFSGGRPALEYLSIGGGGRFARPAGGGGGSSWHREWAEVVWPPLPGLVFSQTVRLPLSLH